jgi:heme-degrading monooxygenase HmoA
MEFAWESYIEPNPESELQGVVGYLHPSRYRTVPRILWHTRKIEAQLAESEGLVGYALRAKVAQKKFWAVAAWESNEWLQNFVDSNPHAEIRMALKREMEESWFYRFEMSGEEVPLTIDAALKRV